MAKTKPSSKLRRFLSVAIVLMGVCLMGRTLLVSPHGWTKWWGCEVSLNGQISSDSTVYRSHNGNILLQLGEPAASHTRVYIIDVTDSKVGVPPGNDALLQRWPGYIYSSERQISTIPLDGSEAKMDQFDAKLKIQPQTIEFNSLLRNRVRIAW